MMFRLLNSKSLLRTSLNNYRLLNTTRILSTPAVDLSSSVNSSSSLSFSTDSNKTPKKWSRHVIGSKDATPEEPKSHAKLDKVSNTEPEKPKRRKRRTLKPLKAPITLTETAKSHLRALSSGPNPKLIRISVRNRGCSGLTYHLEYVDQPEKFDEIVVQDDIKVVIDSKALFSIIGSEMDWVDNKLSSKFVFKNPNSKGTCGCGESFMV